MPTPFILKRARVGRDDQRSEIFFWFNGQPQEQVYDVAWSGKRQPGANGKVPPASRC
jgi:hypothetical protein